jgi:hypothetical protein
MGEEGTAAVKVGRVRMGAGCLGMKPERVCVRARDEEEEEEEEGEGEEEAQPIPLRGTLYKDDEWTSTENTNNPVIVATLGPTVGSPSAVRSVLVTSPPYPVGPVPSPTLEGSITVAGISYVAYLFDYVSDQLGNPVVPFWQFLGADTISSFAPFVLTFTFGGTEYTVTN